MSLWLLLLVICAAGAIGGIANAIMTDNGFALPKPVQIDGTTVVRPGFFGNIIMGAIAAGVSWGLYGPLASYYILGGTNPPEKPGLVLSSLLGAVLVGVGGARWLTNEVDKNLLKATAVQAAKTQPDMKVSQAIAFASPAKAASIASGLQS